ncbi:MAG: FAD-dependent oxidoreductase, partial [Marmoricola sp.]
MADANHADVVILGAGSGGYACALRAAQLGLSVVLVEKADLGGTCLHVGCIPTKALLHAAEVADAAREAGQFGVKATLEGIDMPAVLAYKDGVVQRLFKGLTGLIKGRGITVVEGSGRLVAADTVEVDGTRWTGKNVVLATGSYSRSLPGLEVDGEAVLTSEHALRLDRVPSSAIVLGGGVIGCEFASVWRSFGAEVTIVEALPRLMAAEDADSSKQLERAFRKRKITALTGTSFESLERTADGVKVTVGDTTYAGKHLVLASGSYSRSLPGLDVDGERVLTSEHALRLDRVPRSVVVLGGGVIGCEFASVWRS